MESKGVENFDFVQKTPDGRGERHLHGMIGKLWRIKDPSTVRVGNCFLKGRLKEGDLFLCVKHSGDCFEDYIYIREYANYLISEPKWEFGSYGIGDAIRIEIDEKDLSLLRDTGKLPLKGRLPGFDFHEYYI